MIQSIGALNRFEDRSIDDMQGSSSAFRASDLIGIIISQDQAVPLANLSSAR
jgi:hypothetical protein